MTGGLWSLADEGGVAADLRDVIYNLVVARTQVYNAFQVGDFPQAAGHGSDAITTALEALRTQDLNTQVAGARVGVALLAVLFIDTGLAYSTIGDDETAEADLSNATRLIGMAANPEPSYIGIKTCLHGKASLDGACPKPKKPPCTRR